jgi:hypothetical protein
MVADASGASLPQGAAMTTLQASGLGAMLAWTPSLVLMAWLVHDAPLDEFDRDPYPSSV